MIIFLLFIGLLALIIGAELLVRGASRLAAAFNVSPLVIGLTIVSMGTSSPELALSIHAALTNHSDLVVGNIIGSNIYNVLFILGLCAMIAPLVVAKQLVWLDVPIMIIAHLMFLAIVLDGSITRLDGLLLLAAFIVYILFIIYKSRKEENQANDEYSKAFFTDSGKWIMPIIFKQLGFIGAGLVLCVLGARWMTEGAVLTARQLGISELVIGLTITAAGTSMPEAATSIVAVFRGQRDIAIGNIIGSNIFNILGIMGVAALVAPNGIVVAPAILRFDLPIAIATSVACLPIFFFGHKISRWEGGLFFGYYVAYISYLLLEAKQHDALPVYSAIMLWFVIPLTIITMFIVYYRLSKKKSGIND